MTAHDNARDTNDAMHRLLRDTTDPTTFAVPDVYRLLGEMAGVADALHQSAHRFAQMLGQRLAVGDLSQDSWTIHLDPQDAIVAAVDSLVQAAEHARLFSDAFVAARQAIADTSDHGPLNGLR